MFFPSVLIYILLHEIGGCSSDDNFSPQICQMVLNCIDEITVNNKGLIKLECSGRANLYDAYFFRCINDGYWGVNYDYSYREKNISLQILPFNIYGGNNSPFQLIADDSGEQSFNNLHALIISNIKLKIIPYSFFFSFTGLRTLDLSHNDLTLSDSNQFQFLNNLQSLNLSNNDISAVNHLFKNLPKLEILDLSFNKIAYLPKDFFIYQNYLTEILLNNNEIMNFDVNFSAVNIFSIISIDLSYNQLQDIGTIRDLSQHLTHLVLAHNNITEFNVNLSSSMTHLDLSNNRLKNMSEYVVVDATSMVSINISHNLLELLHTSSFRNLQNLKTLDISDNLLGEQKLGAHNNWLSFFLHFESLESVTLDGNLWDCEDLKDIIFSLSSRSVKLTRGSEYSKSNILGISCIQGSRTSHENSSAEVSSSVISKVLQEVWIRLENVTRVPDASQSDKNTIDKILQISTSMNDKDERLNHTIEAQQTVLKGIASRLEKLEIQINSSRIQSITNESSPEDLNIKPHGSQIDQDTLSKILQISTRMEDKGEQFNHTIEAQQTILRGIASRLEKLEIQVNNSGIQSKTNQSSLEDLNIEHHGSQINSDTLSKILQISTRMNDKDERLNHTMETQQTLFKNIASRLEKLEYQVNGAGTHSKCNQTSSEDVNVENRCSQIDNNTLNIFQELGTKIEKSNSYMNDTLTAIQSSAKIISSRLEHMEQQAKSLDLFSKNNQTSVEELTLLKNCIFSMNSLTNKIGAENNSEMEQVKEELRLLKSSGGGIRNGVWGEIILDLLLFAILSALLYSLYIIVIRKINIAREEVNLVQTL